MAKETTAFKTGMTVLRGGNVPAYTLEYLTPGKRKQIGEFVTIVVPYAEIGRGNNCNIEYGDDYPTVSRKHAAIERRGSEYFLIHLSKTNPTLINGQPISKETLIRNGDEIQLSMEGPRLRFNATPTGTASMGFTKKISLVTKQAIKPYRTLAYSLLGLIILIAGTGGWFIYKQNKDLKLNEQALAEYKKLREQDSLRIADHKVQLEAQAKATNQQITELLAKNEQSSKVIRELQNRPANPTPLILQGPDFYQKYKSEIYFLEVVDITLTAPNGEVNKISGSWTGTAFLCSDGKLVTARHCIQGWRYGLNFPMNVINLYENNGGKVNAKFKVTSQKDSFDFKYSDVVLNDAGDQIVTIYDTVLTELETKEENSQDANRRARRKAAAETTVKTTATYELVPRKLRIISDNWDQDWAYYQTDRTSTLEFDKDLSKNLDAGEKVFILGFSLGKGGPSEGKVNPIFSESNVGMEGLQSGRITLTSRGIEQGNSGGPVFVQQEKTNKTVCIGIVSAYPLTQWGESTTLCYIVPMANLK